MRNFEVAQTKDKNRPQGLLVIFSPKDYCLFGNIVPVLERFYPGTSISRGPIESPEILEEEITEKVLSFYSSHQTEVLSIDVSVSTLLSKSEKRRFQELFDLQSSGFCTEQSIIDALGRMLTEHNHMEVLSSRNFYKILGQKSGSFICGILVHRFNIKKFPLDFL